MVFASAFGASWPAGLLAAFGAVAASTFVYVIYQLWFHPLSKFPGPFWAKMTCLYSGYHAWKGDLHLDMLRCHEKYGNYVRYAPNQVLFNTSIGLHDIYGFGRNTQKSKLYSAMVHRAPNTLTLIDKKAHGRKRRIISQGLSDAALRRYQPAILKHITELCTVLTGTTPGEWSIPRNVAHYFNFLTFDIMSDVLFGEHYNMVTSEENRYVVKAIEDSNVRTSVLAQAPILAFRRWDRKLFAQSILARNKFIQFVNALLQRRFKAAKSARQDVFTFLLDAKDPETQQSLSLAEIGAETTTLVVAGSDTSSTAFSSCLFYLSHNKEWYDRAATEVRNAFTSTEEITLGPRLSSCIYLRACIDESLRLSPPAGSALWREVGPGGATFDGHFVPAGYDVGTGIYAIHHNEDNYPAAFSFRPERWILSGAEGDVSAVTAAFNPFSIGPRGCIGKGLAIAELTLGLATMLWKYDFVLSDKMLDLGAGRKGLGEGRERETEYQLYDHITASKEGPMVSFRERVL
ncbi:cytochrome P450 [Aspergillus heteromorphus CBS 117.55]|uniref:Cytochrome P450 n=1 Tax=Aspergillus heteromorphus CBS 117.55 TaxID=1448321 RepID=A0A317WR90_9EURO|nr:cytochrome P450 [Aspergillus heteromorphus CBS 117.55]PWY87438.1 cytochrome P450 [Aspergillus heteromorphus CBS 117.55]